MERVYASFTCGGRELGTVDFQVEAEPGSLPSADQLRTLLMSDTAEVDTEEGSLREELEEVNGIGEVKAQEILDIVKSFQ